MPKSRLIRSPGSRQEAPKVKRRDSTDGGKFWRNRSGLVMAVAFVVLFVAGCWFVFGRRFVAPRPSRMPSDGVETPAYAGTLDVVPVEVERATRRMVAEVKAERLVKKERSKRQTALIRQ